MPYKIMNVLRMEELVDETIFGHVDSIENSELIFGVTNYDHNGFVLDFDNDGLIEYDILAVYLIRTTIYTDNDIYTKDEDHYFRYSNLSDIERQFLVKEIDWEDYSPVP